MTTLIVGASGATGKQLVQQMIERDQKVKLIVRPTSKIPETWIDHEQIGRAHV